jgi:hypothetical protein
MFNLRKQLERLGVTPASIKSMSGLNLRNRSVINLERALVNHNKNFLRGKEIEKKIGSKSVNGAVFKLTGGSPGTRKVLKIVKSPGGVQEYSFQKNVAQYKLAPNVHNSMSKVKIPIELANKFFSEPASAKSKKAGHVKINAIIMNNLQQNKRNQVSSFNNYMKNPKHSQENKQTMFNRLKNMVGQLNNHRILHGDLHPFNIYVITNPGHPPKLYIIDFGRSLRSAMTTRSTAGSNTTHRFQATPSHYGKMFYSKGGTPHVLNTSKLEMMATNYGVKL